MWRGGGAAAGLVVLALGATIVRGDGTAGTIRASGPVEVNLGYGWTPMAGGPLRDDAALRTGPGGLATLDMTGGDQITLGENTEVDFEGSMVHLVSGALGLRFRPGSPTTIDTPMGTIRTPNTLDAATDAPAANVVVAGDGGTVDVGAGELVLVPRIGGPVTVLAAGQRAEVTDGDPMPVLSGLGRTPGTADEVARITGSQPSDPPIKASPLWAQMATAAAVVSGGVMGAFGFI